VATEKDFRVKSSIEAPTSLKVGDAEITALGSAVVLPANSVISDGAGGTVSVETDLTGYATETYVNTQISNIDYSSYATQTDLTNGLATKVNTSSIATVALTGNYNDLLNKPTIPSLSGYATETYVDNAVSNLIDSAPGTLDTLNELAAALGDDANFASTITNSLATKADITYVDNAVAAIPSALNILDRSGSSVSVSVANGILEVLNRSGSTINVTVS